MGTEAITQRNAKSYKIRGGKIHPCIVVQQKHITGGKRSKETSVNSSTHLNGIHFETSRVPRKQITTTKERTEGIPETGPPLQVEISIPETAADQENDTTTLLAVPTVAETTGNAAVFLEIPRTTGKNTARTLLIQRWRDCDHTQLQ